MSQSFDKKSFESAMVNPSDWNSQSTAFTQPQNSSPANPVTSWVVNNFFAIAAVLLIAGFVTSSLTAKPSLVSKIAITPTYQSQTEDGQTHIKLFFSSNFEEDVYIADVRKYG